MLFSIKLFVYRIQPDCTNLITLIKMNNHINKPKSTKGSSLEHLNSFSIFPLAHNSSQCMYLKNGYICIFEKLCLLYQLSVEA